MKSKASVLFALAVGLTLLFGVPASAEPHRATQLGFPSTRFADPLTTPDDLRARFADRKLRPDFASVLHQWDWQGDLDDLFRAAATSEVQDVRIPIGARMPFMSTRRGGRPILLRDVIWAGKEPVPAYVFSFVSKGRRYRCITPKPCSNFFVEDLGPVAPKLELVKAAPRESGLCDPLEMRLTVRNSGNADATKVTVTDTLPPGLKTPDGRTELKFDAGTLKPGESREFKFQVTATAAGDYRNQARATDAEGDTAEAAATTTVLGATLTLDCSAPDRMVAGRAVPVCLTLRNTGGATEAKSMVTLPIPPDATFISATEGGVAADGHVTWEVAGLAAGASKQVCASFTSVKLATLSFAPAVRGSCAQGVQSECATKIVGIPAILLEVVDLEDPIEVDKEVTYDIRAVNQGFAPVTNMKLRCILPDSQGFVSATGTTPVQAQDKILTMEPIASLEPKGSASWRVVVKALKADDARFKVEFTSDGFELPIHEDESTRQY